MEGSIHLLAIAAIFVVLVLVAVDAVAWRIEAKRADQMLQKALIEAVKADREMPRYFFNVHCETFDTPDLVGRPLPNDDAARAEAERFRRDVLTSGLGPPLFLEKPWIEVVDEEQRPVMLLPLDDLPAEPKR